MVPGLQHDGQVDETGLLVALPCLVVVGGPGVRGRGLAGVQPAQRRGGPPVGEVGGRVAHRREQAEVAQPRHQRRQRIAVELGREAVGADRRAVDRGADQQRPLGRFEQADQVVQERVVDGERDRLGQRPAGVTDPLPGVLDAPLGELAFDPRGHVREPGPARAQQRVQVFQRARVAADVAPGPLLLTGVERVEAGQPPDQLPGLGERQRPEVVLLEPRHAGRRERVPAGDQHPEAAGPADPRVEERRERRVGRRGAARGRRPQVALEVVHQQRDPPPAEHPERHGQPVRRRLAGLPEVAGQLPVAVVVRQPAGEGVGEQHLAELGEDLVGRGHADHRHDQAGVVAEPAQQLPGQAALAGAAEAVHHDSGMAGPAQQGQELAQVGAAAHEVAHRAQRHPLGQHDLRRLGHRLGRRVRVVERERLAAHEHHRSRPLGGIMRAPLLPLGLHLLAGDRGGDRHRRLRGQREVPVERAAEPGRVAVGDRGAHRQHLRDALGQQVAGQAAGRRLAGERGGTAGQHDRGRSPPDRYGPEQVGGGDPVRAAALVLQQELAGGGVAGEVQHVEPLLRHRLPDRREGAEVEHPDVGAAATAGVGHRVQDGRQLAFEVEHGAAVRSVRRGQHDQHPQRRRDADRGRGPVRRDRPVGLDVRMKRECRVRAGWDQRLPRVAGDRRLGFEAEPQAGALALGLADQAGQPGADRSGRVGPAEQLTDRVRRIEPGGQPPGRVRDRRRGHRAAVRIGQLDQVPAEAQPGLPGALGPEAGVAAGRGGGRLVAQGAGQFGHPGLVVAVAEVHPAAAGREPGKLDVPVEHRDEPLAALDRAVQQGGVLGLDPPGRRRGRAEHQDARLRGADALLQGVQFDVARDDPPLGQEHLETQPVQPLGQPPGPAGVLRSVGDEHVELHPLSVADQAFIGWPGPAARVTIRGCSSRSPGR